VRRGFLQLAAGEPRRWVVIDAAQCKSDIASLVWDAMNGLLQKGRSEFYRKYYQTNGGLRLIRGLHPPYICHSAEAGIQPSRHPDSMSRTDWS
jgi:hypothetical protein